MVNLKSNLKDRILPIFSILEFPQNKIRKLYICSFRNDAPTIRYKIFKIFKIYNFYKYLSFIFSESIRKCKHLFYSKNTTVFRRSNRQSFSISKFYNFNIHKYNIVFLFLSSCVRGNRKIIFLKKTLQFPKIRHIRTNISRKI